MNLLLSLPRSVLALSGWLSLGLTASLAGSITAGDLIVERIGDGSTTLGSAAAPISILEFTTGGSSVQTITLPTSGGSAVTDSGSASSDGFMNLSADGNFLSVPGYNAAAGTAGVASTSSSSTNRATAVLSISTGAVVSTYENNTDWSTNNFRSVISSDGAHFWGSGAGTNGGVRYFTTNGSATQISTATNARNLEIFGNNLYFSTQSGTSGIYQFGGLPTASSAESLLFATGAGSAPMDFFLASIDTAYVADSRALASGGGLQKWKLVSGTWTQEYTLTSGLTLGLNGLSASVNNGSVSLFATTSTGSALVSITDNLADTSLPAGSFNTVASAGSNFAFRGVDILAVPEPQTWAMLLAGAGFLGIWQRRRRRQI